MSFQYIQGYYNVPAEIGRRIEYTGDKTPKQGVIVGVDNHYIAIHFDGEKKPTRHFHPTWQIQYLGMGDVPKVKNSRSKARYQRFLDIGECFNSFRDFLGYLQTERDAEKCGFHSVSAYTDWLRTL